MSGFKLVRLPSSPNWYIQWFDAADGHSRRVTTRTGNREEAEAVLRAFALELQAQPEPTVRLDALLDWYAAGLEKDQDRATLCAKHLKAFFGSTLADALTYQKQEAYVAHRRRCVKDETIRRELSVLSAALKKAVKHQRLAGAPPMLTLKKSPPRDRWMTRSEVARLLWHLRKDKQHTRHLLLFTRLALYTGARTGAILDLTWDRVDFARRVIRFPIPGEDHGNKARVVTPMDGSLERALKAAKLQNGRRKGGPVDYVVQYKGKRCDRIVRGFTRNAREIGLEDVTPHILRHTFATWAAMNGASIFLLGKALGHSSSTMTDKYAKHQPEALRSVLKAARRK